jgi:DNA-binding transcriptional regulator YbjK
MAQAYQSAPRGAARREAILRAAIAVIGEQGPDALTHRAVAEEAGVPLSATTYYFDSKEELFREAVALAAREEVERLEDLVLALAPRALTPADWAREVAALLAADVEADPAQGVAFYELVLEAARTPSLRPEVARWEEAHLRLAEVGLRAAGSADPETDARLVVAALSGLVLGQLVTPQPNFERAVLRPTLERLFESLTVEAPAR